MELKLETIEQAVAAALDARSAAYAPYSGFQVGAALVDVNQRVVTGCNVENASFSLTQCAERVAVQRAIVERLGEWSLLVVASPGGVSPCGACRQVLVEFADAVPILLVDAQSTESRRWFAWDRLLPDRFGPEGWGPQTR